MDDNEDLMGLAADAAAGMPMLTALGDVARDEDLWEQANQDTGAFLAERGVKMPIDVTVRPIPWPGFGKPGPEWEPFTIRLTMCRTVWVRSMDGRYRQEEVCRGFEIVPRQVPGGPHG
jgi:hypothetical protein